MAYYPITEQGKDFIRTVCNGTGNSLLQGKSNAKINDPNNKDYNPDGVLPYCEPKTLPSKIWVANAKHNGIAITTNEQLGEALIDWYDKYGKLYEMDANVMAAQAYIESGYKIWNYPLTSTASGISQFTVEAMFDIIIQNSNKNVLPLMTQTEIDAIILGIYDSDKWKIEHTYKIYNVDSTGKKNRPIIHQNMINNPEIMIKAQFRYMKKIVTEKNSLASNVLFGYSRGPNFIQSTYTDTIKAAKSKGSNDYVNEGIDYVYKIFRVLGDNKYIVSNKKNIYFGYDKGEFGSNNRQNLGMNIPIINFNNYDADVAESQIKSINGNFVSVRPSML